MDYVFQGLGIFSPLVDIGIWMQEHPVLTVIVVVTVVVIILVLKFIIKSVLKFGIVLFVILVIGIGLYYGLQLGKEYIPLLSNKFDFSNDNLVFTEPGLFDLKSGLTDEEYKTFLKIEDAIHSGSKSSLIPVSLYSKLKKAPDLAGMTFDEGMRVLQDVANEFKGEIAYFYYEYEKYNPSTGQYRIEKKWSEGTYTSGHGTSVTEDLKKVLSELYSATNKDLNRVKRLVEVHTHPNVVGKSGIPPSLGDRNSAQGMIYKTTVTCDEKCTNNCQLVSDEATCQRWCANGKWQPFLVSEAFPKDIFEFYVVDKLFYWTYDVSETKEEEAQHRSRQILACQTSENSGEYFDKLRNLAFSEAHNETLNKLQPIYACEAVAEVEPELLIKECNSITDAERENAVQRYIELWKEFKFTMTREIGI